MSWNKIRFNGQDADGCIFTVISGLSSWDKDTDPKNVFKEFCLCHLTGAVEYYANSHLLSHYVFSGPSNGGNHGRFPYARAFAEFLEKEKLGVVVKSPMADNKKYHKGRMGEVFIWTPDEKAVNAWWEANRPVSDKRELTELGKKAKIKHKVG